jgi:hypothetical protein
MLSSEDLCVGKQIYIRVSLVKINLEDLLTDFAATRTHSLDETVDFLGLATRLSHFTNDHVSVQSAIGPSGEFEVAVFVRDSFHPNEHVFFGMTAEDEGQLPDGDATAKRTQRLLQPMAGAAGSDDTLKL